ncbi:flagellar biosynthesis protein FlhF [Clostridium cellulovorans]|uniref:Flagellar biosynthesis protein FlhF n=1 Tax=Clostridium cellulovorans (strain ATCC 35296 / DSM 3052 / OCM 3 / 743B) TaxID=573061 RepID=D9SKI0_CLOC7|nr:flagellar biosynthesis protein FlhF [Clostridium cellulovorans]ADL51476.1 flagellar biosynthetic protein FlhF [Clostridium cellulovorans 743B]
MRIKKYVVKNMNEAMTRIRYELGQDAIILSQRRVRKPGIKGFFSSKLLEVTATVDDSRNKDSSDSLQAIKSLFSGEIPIQQNIQKTQEDNESSNKFIDNRNKTNFGSNIKDTNITGKDKHDIKDPEVVSDDSKLVNEMKEMKDLINSLITKENAEMPKEKSDEVTELLEDNDVDKRVIEFLSSQISEDVPSEERVSALRGVLKNNIEIFEKTPNKVVILVGPTGVGKTTTIAKLAGRYSLMEKKKVGLITLDTYRIGAVEQLKTYSEIMNIPFKVIFNMSDMEIAIKEFDYCDIILIDTTGRSSKNAMQISELRAYLHKVATDNIYLVLSSTTKNKDIEAIIEGYRPLNYNAVIITKLDETSTYGSVINILQDSQKPLGFITTGQSVPEDIRVPNKDELVKLILGEEKIC